MRKCSFPSFRFPGKIILLFVCMIGVLTTLSAQTNVQYVAIRTGLNMRDKPEASAKVLEKIPYGTKISLLDNNEEMLTIRTEGILGYWRKVKYNNKTGYIIDSYLFPVAPPKATVKTMKEYMAQISVPFGSKLVVKSGTMNNVEDGGWELHKQLYKNGAEWHEVKGYEYGSNIFILPDFTIKQAFLLLRMIPEFKDAIGTTDEFPTVTKTIKKGEIDYYYKVETEELTEEPWIKRINIDFGDGAVYSLEITQFDNQVVIYYGSGV